MINILVPLDGSPSAEEAVSHAVSIAKTFSAEITLLRVIAEPETNTPVRSDSVDLALWGHQARSYLNRLIKKYGTEAVRLRAIVEEGDPAKTISQYLRKIDVDLLVLTRYGRGNADDFIAGGTAQKIISNANCSILLLDPRKSFDSKKGYQRILVPIDDSKDSDCSVAVAAIMAEISGASLLLLYVVETSDLPRTMPDTRHSRQLIGELYRLLEQEAQKRLQELGNKISRQLAVETRVLIARNLPIAIESAADDYNSDLLLLHSNGANGNIHQEYSSVNQSLIRFSHRPLLIMRSPTKEGRASNFRCVYLNDQHLEAG